MRKRLMFSALAAALAIPAAAQAGGAKAHPGTPAGCPPGLAKKSPACVPPGQAKKHYRDHTRIDGRYILIPNPGRYGLDPNYSYYRMGGQVFRVDRETREVLDLIGAVAAVLD
ncbi:excinuclease ABC subunit A [Cribrihabitans neustonicus]|uniref:excinuclease ABC subunit A n=1 Tax=Cribrihabitans neustonicus TaxID=1429085 RepID=UPI003B5C505E